MDKSRLQQYLHNVPKWRLTKTTSGTKPMKTPTEKFKSKINKIIIRLTNQGNHTTAMQLYQTYFLFKKSF